MVVGQDVVVAVLVTVVRHLGSLEHARLLHQQGVQLAAWGEGGMLNTSTYAWYYCTVHGTTPAVL